jgi:hypothetical protein
VASAGEGSRDEAHDREKGVVLTMKELNQKPEQQLRLDRGVASGSKCETSASSWPLTRASFGNDPARTFRITIES